MRKVLVVEDANFMRLVLKEVLIKGGFEVIEARNGIEAIEEYKKELPDVIIMDITMPKMDGITALRIIKNEYPDAKCIMCSSMGEKPMVIEAIMAGADEFIVKPFQASKVIEIVNKIY